MEGKGQRGRRDKQLLYDLTETRGCWELTEEAPTGTLWRGHGAVAGQTVKS